MIKGGAFQLHFKHYIVIWYFLLFGYNILIAYQFKTTYMQTYYLNFCSIGKSPRIVKKPPNISPWLFKHQFNKCYRKKIKKNVLSSYPGHLGSYFQSVLHLLLIFNKNELKHSKRKSRCTNIFSRPGQNQGLLYKQPRDWLIAELQIFQTPKSSHWLENLEGSIFG